MPEVWYYDFPTVKRVLNAIKLLPLREGLQAYFMGYALSLAFDAEYDRLFAYLYEKEPSFPQIDTRDQEAWVMKVGQLNFLEDF